MGFGDPMEVLGTVVRIEPLTRLGKQGLDVLPYPRGPVTHHAQAYLLFRYEAGLFDLLEGLAQLLLILPLMPTEHMDDTLAIQQREAKTLRVAPLSPPPRAPRALASAPLAGCAGTVGTGRHIRPINAQDHHRTAQAACRHLSKAPLDLLARRCHVYHRQVRGHPVG